VVVLRLLKRRELAVTPVLSMSAMPSACVCTLRGGDVLSPATVQARQTAIVALPFSAVILALPIASGP
jgi:hypothetical protein